MNPVLAVMVGWMYLIGATITFALAAEVTLDNTGPIHWLVILTWPAGVPLAFLFSHSKSCRMRTGSQPASGSAACSGPIDT